jgi:hypothetical protein
MPAVRRARDEVSGDQAGLTPPDSTAAAAARKRRLVKTPVGLVLLLATLLALFLRLFLVTRPGFLTSGTVEYDDGVYLGAALRLLHGALPYKDYAFVQPPGIVLIAFPSALIGSLTTQATGLAVARVASVLASTACVPLVGNLVRHRGTAVVAITSGLLAVYPADILSGRTLLLEPWMNLFCLLGANAAFQAGRLATPQRLALAGLALGFAASVKYWAGLPAALLILACLLIRPVPAAASAGPDTAEPDTAETGTAEPDTAETGTAVAIAAQADPSRARRTLACLGGLAVGFLVPLAGLASEAPLAFLRETFLDQATRTGTEPPLSLRLAHLTGLIDLISRDGGLSLTRLPGRSLFAEAAEASTRVVYVGHLPYAAAAAAIVVIAAGYLRLRGQRAHLEWFALVTAIGATAAVCYYSAFFYHYPDFPAPWLAIAAGAAVGALLTPRGRRRATRAAGSSANGAASGADDRASVGAGSQRRSVAATLRRPVTVVLVLIIAVTAVVEAKELSVLSQPASPPAAAQIPAGACVVADQVSFEIAANRFAAPSPGCPDIIDSLAATLVLSGGVSPQGSAGQLSSAVAGWEAVYSKAQYAWVSSGASTRIPWTGAFASWFAAHFRVLAKYPGYGDSVLYVRDH